MIIRPHHPLVGVAGAYYEDFFLLPSPFLHSAGSKGVLSITTQIDRVLLLRFPPAALHLRPSLFFVSYQDVPFLRLTQCLWGRKPAFSDLGPLSVSFFFRDFPFKERAVCRFFHFGGNA